MEITSPAFVEGGVIPQEFTGDGKNVSPPLSIMGVPEEAKSLVLIMDDVDAPTGVFTHWLVFDLYPGITRLGPGCSPEGTQGKNSFGKHPSFFCTKIARSSCSWLIRPSLISISPSLKYVRCAI